MMLFDIRLKLSHRYAQPAGNGRHLLRVVPASIAGRQRLLAHLVQVEPHPDERTEGLDFFGNRMQSISHLEPHREMVIKMACRVEQLVQPQQLDVSPDLARLRAEWAGSSDLTPLSPLHFLGPSPLLTETGEISAFAREHVDPGQSAKANFIRIGHALYKAMTFDSEATTVDTDASEAFALRRGVCQDFSHILILALRSLGMPAAYVSGYLRTLPPPGKPRLEGVDAMHAWVKAWCGEAQGWVEYDPTNATLVGPDHIVVGYGRDYSDVCPIIGQMRSAGGQTNKQSVDVVVAG